MDPVKRLKKEAESVLYELVTDRDKIDAEIEDLRQKRAGLDRKIEVTQAALMRLEPLEEVPDHRMPLGVQDRVLDSLRRGPVKRKDLPKLTGLGPIQINNALQEMLKYGKVRRGEKRGVWRENEKGLLAQSLSLDSLDDKHAVLDALKAKRTSSVWGDIERWLHEVFPMHHVWFMEQLRKTEEH